MKSLSHMLLCDACLAGNSLNKANNTIKYPKYHPYFNFFKSAYLNFRGEPDEEIGFMD